MKNLIELSVVALWTTVMVSVTTLIGGASGRVVNVGGRDGWSPSVNFTEWASKESFYVGDWLSFKFDKQQYDVVEVNETGYKDCNNNFMIQNISCGAGRDVYQLNESRPYYFICTKGYCWGGMKVAISVTTLSPPAPAPQGNDASQFIVLPLFMLMMSILFAFLMNA